METTTALLIAIPVLVVLAGVLLFASARRRDTGEAIGALARETRKRDRGVGRRARPRRGRARHRPGGRAGRRPRAARGLARRSPRSGPPRPSPWVPPDPEVLGVTRRQFFNRGIVTFFGLGLAGFGAVVLAFLWPKLGGGFGVDDQHRQHRRRRRQDRRRRRASPTTPRAACGSPTTRPPRSAPPSAVVLAARAHRAWRPATRRSTRSACTSAAACRSA